MISSEYYSSKELAKEARQLFRACNREARKNGSTATYDGFGIRVGKETTSLVVCYRVDDMPRETTMAI